MTKRMKEEAGREAALKERAFDRHMRRMFDEPDDSTAGHNPLLAGGNDRLTASNPLLDD